MSNKEKLVFALVASIASLCLLEIESDYDVELREQETYCEMVSLHFQDPDIGWPDYKGIYSEVCK